MKPVLSCFSVVAFPARSMTTMRMQRLGPLVWVLALAPCDGNKPWTGEQTVANDALVAATAQHTQWDAKPVPTNAQLLETTS